MYKYMKSVNDNEKFVENYLKVFLEILENNGYNLNSCIKI